MSSNSASLRLNNLIITGNGPISLPTKGSFSNNTMPFTLNYWPATSVGWPLVSRTAMDYNPPNSFVTSGPLTNYEQSYLISEYLFNNNGFQFATQPNFLQPRP
jgi:hypothetical protein